MIGVTEIISGPSPWEADLEHFCKPGFELLN